MDDVQQKMKEIKLSIQKTRQEVQNISSAQLNEISQYMRPPEVIRFFLEGLFVLLNGQILTWKRITQEMNNGAFIERMLKIDAKQIEQKNFEWFQDDYASDDRWDLKVLTKASQAIAPLALLITQLYQQKKQYDELQKLKKIIDNIKKEQRAKQKKYEDTVREREDLLKKKYDLQKLLENIQQGIFENQKDIAEKQKAWIQQALEKGVQCDLINQDMIDFLQKQNENLKNKIEDLYIVQKEQEQLYQQVLEENENLKNNKIKKEKDVENSEIRKIRGSLNVTKVQIQNVQQQLSKERYENQSLKDEIDNLRKFYKAQNKKITSDFDNQKIQLDQNQNVLIYEIKDIKTKYTNNKSEFEKKTIQYQKEINYLLNEGQDKENQLNEQKSINLQQKQDLTNLQKLYLDQQGLIKTMEGIIKNLRNKINMYQNEKDQGKSFKKKKSFEAQNIQNLNKQFQSKGTQTLDNISTNIFYEKTKQISTQRSIKNPPPKERVSFHVWKNMDNYRKNFNERKSEISESKIKNSPSQFFYDHSNQITSIKSMNNKVQSRSKSQNIEKLSEFIL